MIYGIDVGGTKIELAIFNDEFELFESWRTKTPKHDYQYFLNTLFEMVRKADDLSGSMGSIGVGLPCAFNKNGKAVSANIPCINGQKIASDLVECLQRPVSVINDTQAFTLSEATSGAAESADPVLGIILGTGIAGGLCLEQKMYVSEQRIAGELGHISLSAISQQRYNIPLLECGCGLTGCVQQYLSGPGLLWLAGHLGEPFESVPDLIQAMRDNDRGALQVFDAYVDCLACYFAQLVFSYDPGCIVVGGGLSNIPELFERLPAAMTSYLWSDVVVPPIMPPKFGDSSGVRGAAICGLNNE